MNKATIVLQQDVFSLDEGHAYFYCPQPLTPESAAFVLEWLELLSHRFQRLSAPLLTAAPDAPSSEKQSPPKEEETFLETGKQ